MTILSALGLLQTKGCDEGETDAPSSSSHGMMAFTAVLGFMFLLVWFCVRMGR